MSSFGNELFGKLRPSKLASFLPSSSLIWFNLEKKLLKFSLFVPFRRLKNRLKSVRLFLSERLQNGYSIFSLIRSWAVRRFGKIGKQVHEFETDLLFKSFNGVNNVHESISDLSSQTQSSWLRAISAGSWKVSIGNRKTRSPDRRAPVVCERSPNLHQIQ